MSDLPEQCYFAACPDSRIRVQANLPGTRAGQVLPSQLEVGCIGHNCTLGKHLPLPLSREKCDELLADDEDADDCGPDAARWTADKASVKRTADG